MLKRQRPSSPLPSSSSVPQGLPSEDVINIRDLKRRRIAPPSLDGQARGWDSSNSQSLEDENEEECVEADEQEEGDEPGLAQSSNVEYTMVNSVLKEIHILQKHRQLFHPHPTASNLPSQSHVDKSQAIYPFNAQITSESARVYEHYEDANRQGSVFLFVTFLSTAPQQIPGFCIPLTPTAHFRSAMTS